MHHMLMKRFILDPIAMKLIMKKILLLFLMIVICSVVNSQNIPNEAYGKTLPYTWEYSTTIGKYVCTLNPDGTITSQLISPCRCAYGRCSVCRGLGGMDYGYLVGWVTCRSCFGSGICKSCQGKGYTVLSMSTTNSGVTIGVDEYGRSYVAYPGSDSMSETSREPRECPVCDGTGRVVKNDLPQFGLSKKYCDECKKTVSGDHYHTICTHCGGKGYLK